MIKDSRDATIEHLDLTIRCLVNDMMMLKQELDETKSERDAALENAIRMKSDAEAIDTNFNIPKFDLLEAQCQLKENANLLHQIRQKTKDLNKEAQSIIIKMDKKMNNNNELQDLLNKLSTIIETFAIETEKSFKKEYIKGIDTKTFVRNEHNEDLARSAILAYAKKQGLLKQALENSFLEKALFYWFSRPYHEDDLKKLTLEKAKLYMKPYYRAQRAFDFTTRQLKTEEYDFRTSKIQ